MNSGCLHTLAGFVEIGEDIVVMLILVDVVDADVLLIVFRSCGRGDQNSCR